MVGERTMGKVPLQVRLLISNKFEPLPHTIQRGRRVTFTQQSEI